MKKKLNTVEIGDKFENRSYDLIEKALKNNELGISNDASTVFRKKGYYSKDREKNIIFDLSIEVWPKNAKRYTLLYLIECKSSNSKNVPVDDVEEFYTKINQVAGVNVKGVMISDKSFQSGGLTFAKNKGMMLIEVNETGDHSIILHRTEKDKNQNIRKNSDDLFFSFIKKTLGLNKVIGLKRLSNEQIEELVKPILNKYNKMKFSINIDSFIKYLESEYSLKFVFNEELESVNGNKMEGYFDVKKNVIHIDKSIYSTIKFPFVLGHELGHFFLHSNLRINQEQYNDFKDSEYDFYSDRHILKNDKNWIEWQANAFAKALFLPKDLFIAHLIVFREKLGISRPGHIFLDNQGINKRDYYKTVDYLSDYFGISKISVMYRIEELNLITVAEEKEVLRDVMKRTFYGFDDF